MVAQQGEVMNEDRLSGWGCLIAITASVALWLVIIALARVVINAVFS
jgi:hypothetical protein